LDLKKQLVDSNQVELTQTELEQTLFELMRRYGYGQQTIDLYRMISTFHHRRIPLIIMLGGTGCAGKSTLATRLAERLNLPSVLCTDLIYEILCTSLPVIKCPAGQMIRCHRFDSRRECLEQYDRECEAVQRAMQGFIDKSLTEGKSIIIEGLHITPAMAKMVSEHVRTGAAVFVPFMLTVDDDRVHSQLVREWINRQPSSSSDLDWEQLKRQFDWIYKERLAAVDGRCNDDDADFIETVNTDCCSLSNEYTSSNDSSSNYPCRTDSTSEWMHTIILQRMQAVLMQFTNQHINEH
jgi:2-phosphoglycerate kinase